jgi:hypothetical protein
MPLAVGFTGWLDRIVMIACLQRDVRTREHFSRTRQVVRSHQDAHTTHKIRVERLHPQNVHVGNHGPDARRFEHRYEELRLMQPGARGGLDPVATGDLGLAHAERPLLVADLLLARRGNSAV